MKKNLSKTIMVILAVLLTLVLISTSTVSGIFAKYVVEKQATTTVSLKKFGIKLTVGKGDDFDIDKMSINPTSPDANSLSVEVKNLSLAPGEGFDELVEFTISVDGEVSVDTRIKVKADVITFTNFTVDSGVGDLTASTVFVPIGFTAVKNDAATATDIAPAWTYNSQENLQDGLMNKLGTLIGNEVTTDDYADVKIASAGIKNNSDLTFTTLGFGAYCPATGNAGSYDADEIGTWLAEKGASISVRYTVVLEQITTTNS